MGDLNGSAVYAQPIKTCVWHGLGGNNAAVRSKMHKYGQHLSYLWKSQNMEDISAKGKYAWTTTRTDPNSTSNKLDCIVVSSNVVRDLKAKVTLIKTVTMYRDDLEADWSEGDEPQNCTGNYLTTRQLSWSLRVTISSGLKSLLVVNHTNWHHFLAQPANSCSSLKKLTDLGLN